MDHYRVYLPLKDNLGRSAPRVHADLALKLGLLFGGLTSWEADGFWIGGTENAPHAYAERGRIYDAYKDLTRAGRWHFALLANAAGLALEQEKVMIIVAGSAELITPAAACFKSKRDCDKWKPDGLGV